MSDSILKSYIGIIKLLGVIDIHCVEKIVVKVREKPEKWNKERLSSITPILRPFCTVKWVEIDSVES